MGVFPATLLMPIRLLTSIVRQLSLPHLCHTRYRLFCLGLLWALCASTSASLSCGPAQLGNPCAQGDVASHGSPTPSQDLGIGNPVHWVTGNKYLHEVDLPGTPHAPWLTITRHFNSLDPRHGPLGRGWNLNYDVRLYLGGPHVQILQADGSRIVFPTPAPGQATTTPRGQLKRHAHGWDWYWPNGQRLAFDTQGWLQSMHAPIPQPAHLHIQRHQTGLLRHRIRQLIAHTGQTLTLHYRIAAQHAYLAAIDTPSGPLHYHYDPPLADGSLRLQAVQRPDGMQRRYLYEAPHQSGNPWLPTGIALAAKHHATALRIRHWHYDSAGRVIAASHSPQAPHTHAGLSFSYTPGRHRSPDRQTRIRHHSSGHELLLHSQQQQDRYHLHHATLTTPAAFSDPTTAAPALVKRVTPTPPLLPDHPGHLQHPHITAQSQGWPGLIMHYDEHGRRTRWHSTLVGPQTLTYTPHGRLSGHHTAQGRHWQYHYDDHGHLTQLSVAQHHTRHTSKLQWQHGRITRISHPAETEQLAYDMQGRLIRRHLSRPQLPGTGQQALNYTETFAYDDQGRLTTHHLPEGGTLVFDWSDTHQLLSMHWHDTRGQTHAVIHTLPGQAGYRHGNGLHTTVLRRQGHAVGISVQHGTTPVWTHLRQQDTQGRTTHLANWYGWQRTGQGWRLHYDADSRLIQADPVLLPPAGPGPDIPMTTTHTSLSDHQQHWYAWHLDGGLAAQHSHGRTYRPDIQRDADGLPTRINGWQLGYSPDGRLQHAISPTGHQARYTHNAHGYRLSARHPQATTQYLYTGHRLVAEIHHTAARAGIPLQARHISRRYLYAGDTLIGLIDYPTDPSAPPRLYAVHTDLLGTPYLLTDDQQQVRWLAQYTPTGQLIHAWGDLSLDMRLPGQIADTFTGWHDNLLRTYDPATGAYLEPDPLGPLPGHQALGYARQQPQRYTDPTGLILFAFDGTRQTAQTRGNVWKLSQRYADGGSHYHAGPGNPYRLDRDALFAHQAPAILETQWQRLLDALAATPSHETLPIDIIGYSRGAALARHFGNLIALHVQDGQFTINLPGAGLMSACVDLRFMGLFDTVAQFGLHGLHNHFYDFSIHPSWTRVAHAVALHEYRSWFPLTSTLGHPGTGTVIEAPFIGAHANIGGGLAELPDPDDPDSVAPSDPGDLADVALNWMLWQANMAGVDWVAGPIEDNTVSNPVLHDYRSSALRWLYDGDRRVDDVGGQYLTWKQGRLADLGDPQRQATEPFIQRFDNWRMADSSAVAQIDMAAYNQWLHATLGWPGLPAPDRQNPPDMR